MRRREFLLAYGGGALTYPLVLHAQQKAAVLGLLSDSRAPSGTGFAQGLSETGYHEGQNITIDYRLADGEYERLPTMAADLVRHNVSVIIANGPAAAQAAKRVTVTIPIVFKSSNPVAEGLAVSLARPGGNLTGISLMEAELMPKRIELLSELIPQAKLFAILVNPDSSAGEDAIRRAQDGVRAKGLGLEILKASNDSEIEAAFTELSQTHPAGLVIQSEPFFSTRMSHIVVLEKAHAVPTISASTIDVWAGGLISYGPSQQDALRQMGIYAGRILNGENAADLPVQQPTKFELVINLKTAKSLGLTVPQSLLQRADEVIE